MANSVLAVEDLAKGYGGRVLWSGISFTLRPGEIMAIRGDSGSGKSTLLSAIGLLTKVDSGTIRHGRRLLRAGRWDSRAARVANFGFLFQDFALVNDATVTENLDIAARPRLLSRTLDYSPVLARFGLSGRGQDRVFVLSGGEQQRVALCRLCVRPTPIILADEPTASLDHMNARIVHNTFTKLAAEGRIVVIATHSDDTAAIATKTLRLLDGRGVLEE